ncbi:MAG: hypothetical protein COB37_11365 [Kordiimonadales bacterium]|nr:MAG: hypothetical protein COB37_11365 [Kordiimonadales bacterium]
MRLILLVLSLIMVLFVSSDTKAHEGRPIYIELTAQPAEVGSKYLVRWRMPPVLPAGEIPTIQVYGASCHYNPEYKRLPALTGTDTLECSDTDPSLAVSLSYPKSNPALSTLLYVQNLDGSDRTVFSGPEVTLVQVPKDGSFWETAQQYTVAGTDHILSGYDHLLFVLCLMLLAGSLRRVFLTVTGFTLGHSVTLALSVLGGWSLPPTFVEPLIAFSILILATEIARGKKDTLTYKHPVIISTAFGLLHGFGFAGALAEIGLPSSLQVPALAFFNIGVEIGQIAFVIAVYGAFLLVKPLLNHPRLADLPIRSARIAIYPAGILAAFWTIERLATL